MQHGNSKIHYYLCNYVWNTPSWMQKIMMYSISFNSNLKATTFIHVYDMKRFNKVMS